jgi:hypothetical protein
MRNGNWKSSSYQLVNLHIQSDSLFQYFTYCHPQLIQSWLALYFDN